MVRLAGASVLVLTACVSVACSQPLHELRERYRALASAVELEVTSVGIDLLSFDDDYVLGDAHSDPRPIAQLKVLTKGWRTIASPMFEEDAHITVQKSDDVVAFDLSGEMRERDARDAAKMLRGRWRWHQRIKFAMGNRIELRCEIEQLAPPTQTIISDGYRLQFILPRKQVLGERTPENIHEPGKEVVVQLRDGGEVRTPFGGKPNILQHPAMVWLPFDGKRIAFVFEGDINAIEFWNGGWRQTMNLFLKRARQINARVTLDLSELQPKVSEVVCELVPPRPMPWLKARLPKRRLPSEFLRFVQHAPTIIAYDKLQRHVPIDEKDKFMREVAKHFEVIEMAVAWTDWRYELWSHDEKARKHAEEIIRETQEWIDAAHRNGVLVAISLLTSPGTSRYEVHRVPQFQGEYFDPHTGRFVRDKHFFDWASERAREYAYRAWRAVAERLRDVDFLFFNEPHFRLRPWHRLPLFSEAALNDFRHYLGNEKALFPAKPYCKPTLRTKNDATIADWRRWEDWVAHVYARMLRIQAKAFADANRANPRYRGAIWFQNVEWVGAKWGVDLDKVFAIPEITYVVAEYCTRSDSPAWRQFRYYAHKHGKRLASFVNFGYYDARAPGRVRYDGTDESFAQAVRMGVSEHVDMMAAYPMWSLLPWSPAFHAERVRLWDEITREYLRRVRKHER